MKTYTPTHEDWEDLEMYLFITDMLEIERMQRFEEPPIYGYED